MRNRKTKTKRRSLSQELKKYLEKQRFSFKLQFTDTNCDSKYLTRHAHNAAGESFSVCIGACCPKLLFVISAENYDF